MRLISCVSATFSGRRALPFTGCRSTMGIENSEARELRYIRGADEGTDWPPIFKLPGTG